MGRDVQRFSSLYYFMYVSAFACMCVCAPVFVCCSQESEEHIRSCPGTGRKGDCETPYELETGYKFSLKTSAVNHYAILPSSCPL